MIAPGKHRQGVGRRGLLAPTHLATSPCTGCSAGITQAVEVCRHVQAFRWEVPVVYAVGTVANLRAGRTDRGAPLRSFSLCNPAKLRGVSIQISLPVKSGTPAATVPPLDRTSGTLAVNASVTAKAYKMLRRFHRKYPVAVFLQYAADCCLWELIVAYGCSIRVGFVLGVVSRLDP